MTTITLFKLAAAPFLILSVTWLARRFGPAVGGLMMGIPLLTGPISIFTAVEQGADFARQSAAANLVGQVSTCIFCFVYAATAARREAWASAACGILGFFVATLVWSQFHWSLLTAALFFSVSLAVLGWSFPKLPTSAPGRTAPKWELPARMVVAGCFVLAITLVSAHLGPQLSGLTAPFPVFVLILVVFTHLHDGNGASAAMTKGVILGSPAFGAFFMTVAAGLERLPITVVYLGATLLSVGVGGGMLWLLERFKVGHASA
ncbi:hypothetical protein [Pseudorhodoferax sp.]|uniref:hypothetical protein n=1 Tax=Pseudorhodoferax sp. TaxID=1993553 RepID=UPI0039E2D135